MKNRPWFRDFDGWWYVTVTLNGQRVQKKLVPGKDQESEAYARYHRMMLDLGQTVASPDILFADLSDLFLDSSRENNEPDTTKWYCWFLQLFCEHFPGSVAELQPHHVTRWLARQGWGQSTRRQAITCIKRVVNWAVDEGHVKESPLRKLKRPKMLQREVTVTQADHDKMVEGTDRAFRDVLFALRQTGARPGEIRNVTASMVDLKAGVWILEQHKTAKKTGKPRIIYLTEDMVTLTKSLMELHPTGPLFLNKHQKPWTSNAIRCRMRRMRKKHSLKKGTVAYSYRHTFITDALVHETQIADLAELCGHVDTKMISEFYSKLGTRTEHLRKAAQRAVGK